MQLFSKVSAKRIYFVFDVFSLCLLKNFSLYFVSEISQVSVFFFLSLYYLLLTFHATSKLVCSSLRAIVLRLYFPPLQLHLLQRACLLPGHQTISERILRNVVCNYAVTSHLMAKYIEQFCSTTHQTVNIIDYLGASLVSKSAANFSQFCWFV